MQYVEPKYIHMKSSSEFNEKWIQDLIEKDPGILGLGTLSFVSKEKSLPGGGRVDLVLGDDDDSVRYEVEVQLGKTDPSHIIRVLEYWDIEKKRYPQYDHVAVLVAEEITARFFNVISLFNGAVPIIAVQMKCVEVEGKVTIVFSKILDLMALDRRPIIGPVIGATSRAEWEKKIGKEMLGLIDELKDACSKLPEIDGDISLAYMKSSINLVCKGKTSVYCYPQKKYVRVAVKLPRSTETDDMLSASNLDVMNYNTKLGRYRVRMHKDDDTDYQTIAKLISLAYEESE